jgi:hypothetical protein
LIPTRAETDGDVRGLPRYRAALLTCLIGGAARLGRARKSRLAGASALARSHAFDDASLRILLILAVVTAFAGAFGFLTIHAADKFLLRGHPAIGKISLAGCAFECRRHIVSDEEK